MEENDINRSSFREEPEGVTVVIRALRELEDGPEIDGALERDLEVFLSSIDFEALSIELFAPLFEAQLSSEDLAAVLAFYESPAGKAWSRERTAIARAASREMVGRMQPTVETFMRQWFDTELRELQQRIDEVPPGPSDAPNARDRREE